jgi:hypothetical protein
MQDDARMQNHPTHDSDVSTMRTDALLELMRIEPDAGPEWSPDDFGAILCHQLSLPIEADFEDLSAELARHVVDLCVSTVPPIGNHAELLHHSDPPLELLDIVKKYAKACRDHVPSALPPDVATVLYFLSTAAALVRHQTSLSGLTHTRLRDGLDWVRRRTWVGTVEKRIVEAALAGLAE